MVDFVVVVGADRVLFRQASSYHSRHRVDLGVTKSGFKESTGSIPCNTLNWEYICSIEIEGLSFKIVS